MTYTDLDHRIEALACDAERVGRSDIAAVLIAAAAATQAGPAFGNALARMCAPMIALHQTLTANEIVTMTRKGEWDA